MQPVSDPCRWAGPESAGERIPRGLLAYRTGDGVVPLTDRRFSAACCGELRCRSPRRRIVRCGGFTLLEVMIAMAILAITLVALYQSQSQSISMATDSRFLTTASLLAQTRMAEIDAARTPAAWSPRTAISAMIIPATPGGWRSVPWRNSRSSRFSLTVTQGRMVTRNTYRLLLYKVVTS